MGLGGTRGHWHGLDAALAEGRRVIAFDPRGVGASERAPGPYAMRELAADALAVLDAAGAARADVLGVSLGGMIAQELALASPERVRALVLGCTSARGDVFASAPPSLLARLDWRGKRAEAWVRDLLGANLGARFRAERPEEVERLVAWSLRQPVPRASMEAQLAALAAHDVAARLGEIAAPALVLHGEADELVASEAGRRLAAGLPRARFASFAGAGHLFWVEEPARAAALVGAFLDDVAGGRG